MKIKVSKNELYGVLKMSGKVVGPHKTVPMFENYMLVIDERGLTITGSDGSGMIVGSVETISIEDQKTHSLLVDKTLFNALAELSEQPLEICINESNNHVTINYQNGVFELQGQSASAYPVMSMSDEPVVVNFDKKQLIEGIKTVAPFAANDELRPIMSGVYVEAKDSVLSFVATDANMLALREYKFEAFTPDECFGAVIPTKAAKIILSVIEGNKADNVIAKIGNKNIGIETEKYMLTYRLLEGRYPNYRNVIPKTHETKLTLNTEDFISVIRRVSVFSNTNSKLLKLDINSGVIKVDAEDVDFSISATETTFADIDGKALNIGFHAGRIVELFGAVETESCEFKLIDPARAGIIQPIGIEGVTLLIMPFLINK